MISTVVNSHQVNKMLAKFIVFLSVFPMFVVRGHQHDTHVQPGPPDFCLKGPYHKPAPSIEDQDDFLECLSWSQNVSCCNANVTESIRIHKDWELYNFSWDVCSNLSHECEKFIKVYIILYIAKILILIAT